MHKRVAITVWISVLMVGMNGMLKTGE